MTIEEEKVVRFTQNRLKVLKALRAGPRNLRELGKKTGIAYSEVSRCVKDLEKSGLVSTWRVGKLKYAILTSKGYVLLGGPIVERKLIGIFWRIEDFADERVGSKLGLPPLREVRKALERELGLIPLEELILGKKAKRQEVL